MKQKDKKKMQIIWELVANDNSDKENKYQFWEKFYEDNRRTFSAKTKKSSPNKTICTVPFDKMTDRQKDKYYKDKCRKYDLYLSNKSKIEEIKLKNDTFTQCIIEKQRKECNYDRLYFPKCGDSIDYASLNML